MTLTDDEFKTLVNNAYAALEPLNNIGRTDYLTELYKLCYEEEKAHRKGRDAAFRQSVKTTAKYFAIKAFLTLSHYSLEGIIYAGMSIAYGASLNANFSDKINHENEHLERFRALYLNDTISYMHNIAPLTR